MWPCLRFTVYFECSWALGQGFLARLMIQEGDCSGPALLTVLSSYRGQMPQLQSVAVQAATECARAPRRTGGPVWPVILRSRDYIGGPCRVRHTGRFGAACNIVLEPSSISPAGRISQSPHSSCGSNGPSPITVSARLIKASSLSRCSSESWSLSLMPMPPCCRAADRWRSRLPLGLPTNTSVRSLARQPQASQ